MRTMLYLFFRFWIQVILRFTAKIEVRGANEIPQGPYLVAANHISHFDPPVIGALFPLKMDFMGMRELFKNPIIAQFFYQTDVFPVSRGKSDRSAIRTALERLAKGRIVCMFPEGGLRTGKTSVLEDVPLKTGASVLAELAQVPVRPCLILGTDRFYSWRWGQVISIIFIVGKALELNRTLPLENQREDLNLRIESAIRAMYQEAKMMPLFDEAMIPRTAQERWAEAKR